MVCPPASPLQLWLCHRRRLLSHLAPASLLSLLPRTVICHLQLLESLLNLFSLARSYHQNGLQKLYQQKLFCQYMSLWKLRLGTAREQERDYQSHGSSCLCEPADHRDIRLGWSTCSTQQSCKACQLPLPDHCRHPSLHDTSPQALSSAVNRH